ncbi:MAG: hypothetical protein RID53_30600 [Coleofasciculus sp. B1-GNL1-01]|uniref:hypothetical protein n=1 Tax=Coleofasciculus sp. B1-GNL1-01 TaxID=3068484 RepID=UPI003300906A
MKKSAYVLKTSAFIAITTIIGFLFSVLVIKNFSDPLAGGGDLDYWEYTGFYLSENFSIFPFPHLDLLNNQSFYPYGVEQVFQPWSLERDFIYAICYKLFGLGAWLQFYYLASVLLTAIGSFLLLAKDYGFVRASWFGIVVSFCNFYAIHKYPVHLSYSVIHWMVLGFVTDFILVKKIVYKENVSLKFVLLKICFCLLALGQELGYITGYTLMSLSICMVFVIFILGHRHYNNPSRLLKKIYSQFMTYKHELIESPRIHLALLGLIFLLSYIYLPLIIQIYNQAKSFDFTGINNGAWWTHPVRLLIPYLPWINPGQPIFTQILKDSPTDLGSGSTGWFLLILGITGLWQARKQRIIFIPLVIIFISCILYHPVNFPILKLFPWFTFNRVQGRCTVLYPVILGLLSLHIDFSGLKKWTKSLISILLICLSCMEIYIAYSFKFNYQPYSFDKNFFSYMNRVKQQPGEAVLDWPFCVVGGNGVGAGELCPYYKNASVFSLRRFHQKKVMGQYFGRLHPDQIKPYLDAGWNKLFFPDSPDIFKATRQTRCFSSNEWSFFTEFYAANDFSGINLYVDLLPENCVQDFYERFGQPIIETQIPSAGTVKFIPKDIALKNQVNLALGSKLKFEPLLDLVEFNLLESRNPSGLTITGLSEIEQDQKNNRWRWGLGPETRLSFQLSTSQKIVLTFSFHNPIDNQEVLLEINGQVIRNFLDISKDTVKKEFIEFSGKKGVNSIVFKYNDWNHNNISFAPKDQRNMAIYFTEIKSFSNVQYNK